MARYEVPSGGRISTQLQAHPVVLDLIASALGAVLQVALLYAGPCYPQLRHDLSGLDGNCEASACA